LSHRFTSADRLHTQGQFDRVFEGGRAFRYPELTLRAVPNGLDHSRLGLLVGRRHGNAVRRNRIKRVLRECFRLHRGVCAVPCDVVIIPHARRRTPPAALAPVFREALRHAGEAFAHR
jgi:ribonuclease P protein component